MGIFETGHAAAEIIELRERTERVRSDLEGQIREEGGEVLSVRSLNSRLILHSPFPSKLIRINSIGGRPVLLQMRVRYPTDAGSWFVFAPNEQPTQWAWKSDTGREELPVVREGDSWVHNQVVALPLWAGGLIYVVLVLAVMLGLGYYASRR
jgi:hypothetical protein